MDYIVQPSGTEWKPQQAKSFENKKQWEEFIDTFNRFSSAAQNSILIRDNQPSQEFISIFGELYSLDQTKLDATQKSKINTFLSTAASIFKAANITFESN